MKLLTFKLRFLFFTLTLLSSLVSRESLACNYIVSVPVTSFPSTGGSATASITGCNGKWNASSSATWLTLSTSSATGPTTLTYTVAPNTTTTSRTAILTIDGQQFTITEACTYSLSAYTSSLASTGGNGSVNVQGCSGSWTVTNPAAWVHPSTLSGTGPATLTYSVDPNSGTTSRNATLTIAGLSYTITQAVDTAAPSVPTLAASAASSSQINLSWTASTDTGGSGLAGYKIFRSGVQIATTAGTSYSDSGLSGSTAYCYTVAAYDGVGNTSAQSASQCATTLSTAPPVPTSLVATPASASQINLSWAASSGATGYKVYRAGVQIATATTTSYSDTGLVAGTQYCYTVAAYNSSGVTSAQSGSQCATTISSAPPVPTGLSATAASSSQINLGWTASSGATGYKIYRAGVQIATATTTSYSDTGLVAGTQYCYTVAAYNSSGVTSAQSTSQCATTSSSAPPVPTGLSATAASSTQINLSWTASSGATGYKVYRAGVQVGTATTTSYSDTGLVGSTQYCYTVAAYNSSGVTSAQSTSQCATTSTVVSGPVNDNFASAAVASVGSNITGSNVGATKEAGEPNHAGNAGGHSVWWKWTAPAAGSATISLAGSSFDTLLGVYTGSSVSALTVVASNDDFSGTTSQATFTATGGVTYQIAVDGYGGATGNITMAIAQTTSAPPVPTGLIATAISSTQINLSWGASSGATGYKIYRAGIQVGTATTTTYADTGLVAGTQYCYTVAAYDSAGNTSAQSASQCATTSSSAPPVPTGLIATAISSTQINLSWGASSGATGYKIYRAGVQIATATTTTYADTGLSAGTQYCYTVAAYNSSGVTSAQSTSQCATTSSSAPPVPTGLTATAASSTQINLAWGASTGAAGYKIYRAGVQVGTSTTTSYSNTGLNPATQYCFTVAAYNSSGVTSAQSTSQCATTSPDTTAPTIPAGLTVTAASSTQNNLSWSASTDTGGSGLAGYKIFRAGVQIATTTATSYSDTGRPVGNSDCYTVAAYDNAGNTSAQSAQDCIVPPQGTIAGTWVEGFGGSLNDTGRAVAVDGLGNIYTVGTFYGTATFGAGVTLTSAGSYDIYLCKVSPDGTLQWAKSFGSTGSEAVQGLLLDSTGNIYLFGSFSGTVSFGTGTVTSAGGSDGFLAKYSSQGGLLWARTIGGATADYVTGIALDKAQQNVIVTGSFSGLVYFSPTIVFASADGASDTFLGKYSAAEGSAIWVKTFSNADRDTGVSVLVDANDNILLSGYFASMINLGLGNLYSAGTLGRYDIFMAKFAASGSVAPGAPIWASRLGGADNDLVNSAIVDRNGDLILCGTFSGQLTDLGTGPLVGTGSSCDIFLAKYSGTSGNPLWCHALTCSYEGIPYSVSIDSNNNPVICGYFSGGTCSFGTVTLTSVNSSRDAFVAKFSGSSGTTTWAEGFGGTGSETAYSVYVDAVNYPIVTGSFENGASFGGAILNSNGGSDSFLLRLDP